MTTVTINDTDYETDNMSDKQKEIVQLLQQNLVSVNMLEHWMQCVKFVGEMKTRELEKSLKEETEMVRARNEKGHYIADDPDTPENEAWVEKPKEKKE
jgi:hypothetical protein|tara:strand:+ start:695 stop:988 length:294 start_codon:yes stop_codon:yes gene_type:complete